MGTLIGAVLLGFPLRGLHPISWPFFTLLYAIGFITGLFRAPRRSMRRSIPGAAVGQLAEGADRQFCC